MPVSTARGEVRTSSPRFRSTNRISTPAQPNEKAPYTNELEALGQKCLLGFARQHLAFRYFVHHVYATSSCSSSPRAQTCFHEEHTPEQRNPFSVGTQVVRGLVVLAGTKLKVVWAGDVYVENVRLCLDRPVRLRDVHGGSKRADFNRRRFRCAELPFSLR